MTFRKTTLSSSIALIVAGMATTSLSQEQMELEEIIVQGGIRESLRKSMDIKRDSTGVVDAITAEDIGKFPDTNLAEALQRVTGVSINRERGEGSQITVRGFGPEYNLVTLNGRQMPTTNLISRSFDFGNLAAEGISGVQVYKTGRADVPTGGIGSLINISTTRPLDAPGEAASFTFKGKNDPSAGRGNDITPEGSGIYRNTFADDTIGIAISASYSERDNGVNSYTTSGWFTELASTVGGTMPPDNDNQINRPSPTENADIFLSTPRQASYTINEYSSQRVNGQLTLQWAASDTVEATVDYTYTEFELARAYNSFGGWFSHNSNTVQTTWETFGSHASPLIYTEISNPSDNAMALGFEGNVDESESVGLNLAWQAKDNLRLEIDHHNSEAKQGAAGPEGTGVNLNIASYNRVLTRVDYRSELPIMTIGMDSGVDPDGDGPLDPVARPLYKSDMRISGSVIGNEQMEMGIEQSRFKGKFEVSDVTSIDFGFESSKVENQGLTSSIQQDTWGGVGDLGLLDDVLTRASMSDQFDQIEGNDDPARTTDFFIADAADIKTIARQIYTDTGKVYQEVGDCGDGYCPSTVWEVDRYTEEESISAYVQLNHSTELLIPEYGTYPLNIQLGIRHEETDITSMALAPDISEVYTAGGNEVYYKFETQVKAPYTGSYEKLLPSVDIDLTVRDDVVLRVSASQTITRPSYTDIQGGITASGTNFPNDNRPRAAGGNPGLEPILASNLDISFEWYYGEDSYFSLGYFVKDTEDFIGTSFRDEALFGDGGLADFKGTAIYAAVEADVIASGNTDPSVTDITSQILSDYNIEGTVAFQNLSGSEVYVENGEARLRGIAGQGDPLIWEIRSPANIDAAVIDGIEINLQHTFGDTGFGVIANATLVSGNVQFDNNNLEAQFALNGLSDSANLIAFYDKDKFEMRVAYNWRDNFLAGVGQDQGRFTNPQNVRGFSQIDISANYQYSENIRVFFAGINIGESTYRVYSRQAHQVLQMGQTGARYDFGITYNF